MRACLLCQVCHRGSELRATNNNINRKSLDGSEESSLTTTKLLSYIIIMSKESLTSPKNIFRPPQKLCNKSKEFLAGGSKK